MGIDHKKLSIDDTLKKNYEPLSFLRTNQRQRISKDYFSNRL